MDTLVLGNDCPNSLRTAVEILKSGGLVAFPTDTVYGVGALVHHHKAIEKLFTAKGRDATRAIAVLIGNFESVQQVTDGMGQNGERLAKAFWPGPLTLVVQRHLSLPDNLSPDSTIGVRMPDHPAALELLNMAGPLAVTSANLSGKPNSVTANQVLVQLGGKIDLILDRGASLGSIPSTVVDCTSKNPNILRQGPISSEDIFKVLKASTNFP